MPRGSTKVRLLILETDEPHPRIQKDRGGYADILDNHFNRAAAAHDPPLELETDMRFVVEDKEGGQVPKAEEFKGFDGVLITGSMYDAHTEGGWVEKLLDTLKVEPVATGDWELGHSRIDLTSIGKQLFRTEDDHIHLHQMHQDHVVNPPNPRHPLLVKAGGITERKGPEGTAEVHVWGSSPHTSVQGLYIPQRVFTTQAHIAFDAEMVKREIEMRVKKGAIDHEGKDADEVDKAHELADADHDGLDLAVAILRFFAYEDDGIE